ncbi:hypothetical protein JW988_02190 [Candidatus Bathyarchaeota archaeon]|nr:hypothetical protein [Candidatus Bathyarchaeota archaeon]
MTKSDDVLLELSRRLAAYMESVFPFQYEGKVYQLINNYVTSLHMRCDVCGTYPIFEVSIIKGEDGQQLNVGNNCIDRLTNRQLSSWFKNYREKRENIIRNRKYIDGLSLVLDGSLRNEFALKITDSDIERLSLLLEKLINGFNPDRRESQLAECYIKRTKYA